MTSLRSLAEMASNAAAGWYEDNATRLSAALAYYTLFSLAPIFIIVTAVAGFAFGDEAVRGQLDDQLDALIGRSGADLVQEMVKGAKPSGQGAVGLVLGVLTMIIGATGVFAELRSDLNHIWRVPPPTTGGIGSLFRDRAVSFAMVVAIGFVLLASLVVNAVLVAAWTWVGGWLPLHQVFMQLTEVVVSLLVISLLFATMYKLLPDAHLPWSDCWLGGIVTALLFTAGKTLIGFYLGQTGVASTYGAAGSIVALLVWIYYSSAIFFFGAEFTKAYSHYCGSRCELPVASQPPRMVAKSA